jgi:hypothetical protein
VGIDKIGARREIYKGDTSAGWVLGGKNNPGGEDCYSQLSMLYSDKPRIGDFAYETG